MQSLTLVARSAKVFGLTFTLLGTCLPGCSDSNPPSAGTGGAPAGAGAAACQASETLCSAEVAAGAGGASANAGDSSAPHCANLQTDANNCGCCGNACKSGRGCRAGRCDDTTRFSFFVFGDMHAGPTAFDARTQIAMAQMKQIDADAIGAVSNGDLVDVVSDAQWAQHDSLVALGGFQREEACSGSFADTPRYFGTLGDHDSTIGSWFASYNQHLPAQQALGVNGEDGSYYSVKFANALYIMLDSEHLSDAQTSWLRATLSSPEATSAELKFMFFHEPVYSCSSRHAPVAEELPWIDLAEQNGVNVVFGSHTHLYTRSCAKRAGACSDDGGVVYVETGPLGGEPRALDVTAATVSGMDAAGNDRSDTYHCSVGDDLMAAQDLVNDFCHVRVDGCTATFNCYEVAEGNSTPFDSWSVSGCP